MGSKAQSLAGLPFLVHTAERAPARDFSWTDAQGATQLLSVRRWMWITDLGEVEIVAARDGLGARLAAVDTARARALAELARHWQDRKRQLAKRLAQVWR